MTRNNTRSQFKAKLLRPETSVSDAWCAFVTLPKNASSKLPRRGKTTVAGTLNGYCFQATLEPDGQLGHWLPVSKELLEGADVDIGDAVSFAIMSVDEEPEPEVPSDLLEALAVSPEARAVWDDTTTVARVDWIHWITSAKQLKTRTKRISDACDMLGSGKRRVCCFDPSGYYSKAFGAPKAAD